MPATTCHLGNNLIIHQRLQQRRPSAPNSPEVTSDRQTASSCVFVSQREATWADRGFTCLRHASGSYCVTSACSVIHWAIRRWLACTCVSQQQRARRLARHLQHNATGQQHVHDGSAGQRQPSPPPPPHTTHTHTHISGHMHGVPSCPRGTAPDLVPPSGVVEQTTPQSARLVQWAAAPTGTAAPAHWGRCLQALTTRRGKTSCHSLTVALILLTAG